MNRTTAWVAASKKKFRPTDIANCVLWLPTSAYSLGGGVLTGADQSGNHNDCTQSTGANQPTIVSPGSPADYLSFGGTHWLQGNLSIGASHAITMFTLVKDTSGATGTRVVWTSNDNYEMQHFGSSMAATWGSNNAFDFSAGTTDVLYTGWSDASTAVKIYKNGTFTNTSSIFTAGSSTTYRVGANYSGSSGWVGRIYEIVVYSTALNDTDRGKVEDYLKAKVGL